MGSAVGGVYFSAGSTETTTNSVKAPECSGRGARCALHSCSRQSRSHSRRFAPPTPRSSACLARRSCSLRCAGCDSLASAHSVRGDVARLPGAIGPFHSRPFRLANQPNRAGMKGATRSANPDDASTRASERAQRGPGAQRVGAFTLSVPAVSPAVASLNTTPPSRRARWVTRAEHRPDGRENGCKRREKGERAREEGESASNGSVSRRPGRLRALPLLRPRVPRAPRVLSCP